MVFSFFKKPPEKMVAKPAAVPRPKEPVRPKTPAAPPPAEKDPKPIDRSIPLEFTPAMPSAGATGVVANQDLSLDFTDSEFNQSSINFQVDNELVPVDSDAEEAAIVFANGQDAAARALLENAIHSHHSSSAERLWRMLFDLYRIIGEQAAFESLGIEFARTYEKSPPIWRGASVAPAKPKDIAAGNLLFKGDLVGTNSAAFAAIGNALDKNPKLRLDLSKVERFDADGCGKLLSLLQQARKLRRDIELLGRDRLGVMLHERVEVGRAEGADCWLLFLELCQLQGQQEIFEDVAVDFAVTFELSPPSWEANRVAAPEPPPAVNPADDDHSMDDAFVLRGELKGARFADLTAFAEVHDPVVIDCSTLTRMDFISAGVLQNVIAGIRRTGRQIVFRHPNHLVAELLGVVGVRALASIVLEKH